MNIIVIDRTEYSNPTEFEFCQNCGDDPREVQQYARDRKPVELNASGLCWACVESRCQGKMAESWKADTRYKTCGRPAKGDMLWNQNSKGWAVINFDPEQPRGDGDWSLRAGKYHDVRHLCGMHIGHVFKDFNKEISRKAQYKSRLVREKREGTQREINEKKLNEIIATLNDLGIETSTEWSAMDNHLTLDFKSSGRENPTVEIRMAKLAEIIAKAIG